MMENQAIDWRRPFWLLLLVAASVGFSLGFACAVPLAAFAAFAVLTMPRGWALLSVALVVGANQGIGFTLLHYPADAWGWSAAFLAVGVLAVLAADAVKARNPRFLQALMFAAAFAAYEGGLFLLTIAIGGHLYAYAAAQVLRILAINALAFAVLLALRRGAIFTGLYVGKTPALKLSNG